MKTLKFSDILRIGHTTFETDGFTSFVCGSLTCNIESILLREMLSLENYEIILEEDFVWGKNTWDWIIKTNLPFSVYEELCLSNSQN